LSYSDTFRAVTGRTYTYTLSYTSNGATTTATSTNRNFRTYQCTEAIDVVAELTECNDGLDNADTEDIFSDRNDPACHTDGDPFDGDRTYNATTTSETNAPTNLQSAVQTGPNYSVVATEFNLGDRIYIRGTTTNTTNIHAAINYYGIGYRLVGASDATCASGRTTTSGWYGSRTNCESFNGKTYIRLTSVDDPFSPRQARRLQNSWMPSVAGTYEVCMISDIDEEVIEGDETDNLACSTISVTPALTVDVKVRTAGGTSWLDSLTMASGTQAELQCITKPGSRHNDHPAGANHWCSDVCC
jgi:hypothetical protein